MYFTNFNQQVNQVVLISILQNLCKYHIDHIRDNCSDLNSGSRLSMAALLRHDINYIFRITPYFTNGIAGRKNERRVTYSHPSFYPLLVNNRNDNQLTGYSLYQNSNFSTLIVVNSFRIAIFLMKEGCFS